MWTSLREIFAPDVAYLVYLDVPDEEIRQRLRAEDVPELEIEELERDDTETDLITQIPQVADVQLAWQHDSTIPQLTSKVMELLPWPKESRTLIDLSIASEDNWKRYHELVSVSLRRKLTSSETKELLTYETIAATLDLNELVQGRESLRSAKQNHEKSLASISQLCDALERWLGIR